MIFLEKATFLQQEKTVFTEMLQFPVKWCVYLYFSPVKQKYPASVLNTNAGYLNQAIGLLFFLFLLN